MESMLYESRELRKKNSHNKQWDVTLQILKVDD